MSSYGSGYLDSIKARVAENLVWIRDDGIVSLSFEYRKGALNMHIGSFRHMRTNLVNVERLPVCNGSSKKC